MIHEYQLRILPEQAASEQSLKQYISREKGLDVRTINAIRILKRSIGTRHCFYIGLTGNFLSEIDGQFNSFLVRGKEIKVARKYILLVFQVDTLRKVARFSGHRHNPMRLRIQDKSFVVYFFSGNSSYILFLRALGRQIECVLRAYIAVHQ